MSTAPLFYFFQISMNWDLVFLSLERIFSLYNFCIFQVRLPNNRWPKDSAWNFVQMKMSQIVGSLISQYFFLENIYLNIQVHYYRMDKENKDNIWKNKHFCEKVCDLTVQIPWKRSFTPFKNPPPDSSKKKNPSRLVDILDGAKIPKSYSSKPILH